MTPRHLAIAFLIVAAAPLAAQQGKRVAETEPNDNFDQAMLVQFGDTIVGDIHQHSDHDFFQIDIPAGKIRIALQPQFCPGFQLLKEDRQTGVAGLNCYSAPDTIYLTVTTAGRYYMTLRHDDDRPDEVNDPPLPYKLRVGYYEPPPTGLGNPMSVLASYPGEDGAMVPAPNGDVMVVAYDGGYSLKRVTPDGHITTFATGVTPVGQIAIDAFGDLLVPSGDQGGVVWRYDLKTGARTIFTGPPAGAQFGWNGITIGADGDVWLSTPGGFEGATFWRFDALGNYKSQIGPLGHRTFWLTTAQNGELFFMAQDSGDVYRMQNNTTPVRVITAPSSGRAYGNRGAGMGAVALDRDGWVYLIQPYQGKLLLFNPQYQLVRDPLAQVLDSLGWKSDHLDGANPTWMRDKNGKMTSRLLVARSRPTNDEPGPGDILEVNPRAMGAPGADPLLHPKRKTLRNAAVNAAYADTLSLDGESSATWSFVSGQLPDGVSLSSSGVLTGTPTRKATYDFVVKAVNGARAGFGRFSITVGDSPPVQVTVEAISDALMGGAALPAATVQYLDNLGNKNGRLDVGDFRAYLRSQGQLGGAPKP